MRLSPGRAIPIALATLLGSLATAGTALAYWGSSGAGSGTAQAGTASPLSVTPAKTAITMIPGGTSDITVTIENPADYPVRVISIGTSDVALAGFADPGFATAVPTCDATRSGVTVLAPFPRSTDFTIAARGSYTLTIAKALAMSNESDDSCQGRYFRLQLTASGQSAAGGEVSSPAAGGV